MSELKVLFIGDIIGKAGRRAVKDKLPSLIKEHVPHLVIANGENSAGGFGITPDIVRELLGFGIDIITTGNHVWDKKEIVGFIDNDNRILRPANFPPGVPGYGYTVCSSRKGMVGVINLQGRVFMNPLDCPFRTALDIIEKMKDETKVILIDFHGEATSEKNAMALFLDGRVSGIIGTHTHVQTADERILPKGTAYITDVGMTGALQSVIGIKMEQALRRFLTQMPQKFQIENKDMRLMGAVLSIDASSGKAYNIKRLNITLN